MAHAYSTNLQQAVSFAAEESSGLGTDTVRSEHLFLALTRLAGDPAAEYLRQNGLTLPFVLREVDRLGVDQPHLSVISAEAVLAQSEAIAQGESSDQCATEHLLKVLLQMGADTVVGQVFLALGSNLTVPGAEQFMQTFEVSDEKVERLRSQIITWENRAQMAEQMGFADLAKQALEYKRKYEKLLKITLEKKQEEN